MSYAAIFTIPITVFCESYDMLRYAIQLETVICRFGEECSVIFIQRADFPRQELAIHGPTSSSP